MERTLDYTPFPTPKHYHWRYSMNGEYFSFKKQRFLGSWVPCKKNTVIPLSHYFLSLFSLCSPSAFSDFLFLTITLMKFYYHKHTAYLRCISKRVWSFFGLKFHSTVDKLLLLGVRASRSHKSLISSPQPPLPQSQATTCPYSALIISQGLLTPVNLSSHDKR